MGRPGKSGVRGLFRRVRYFHPTTGERISDAKALRATRVRPVEAEAWEIDLRWRVIGADGWMVPRRYSEQLPDGIKAAAARAHTLTILNAIKEGTFAPDAPAPVRLHAALDEYLRWAETNRPKTHSDRVSIARRLKAGLADGPLDDLTPRAIERYKHSRLKQAKQRRVARELAPGELPPTVAPATVNREIAMLKHLASIAATGALPGVTLDAARADAVRRVRLLREPPGRVRSLSPDEEARILATLPSGLRTIVEVADLTGMRRAEVARLRREQVDLRNREILLTQTKTNRVRCVPISDVLAPILQTAADAAEERAAARSDGDEAREASGRESLFVSRRGLPYTLDAITRGFHRAVVKAAVPDVTFHDVRHSHATKLRRRGVGLDVIAKLLGHSQIATSARYAHVEADLLRAAVADLPGMKQPTAEAATAQAAGPTGRPKRRGRNAGAQRR